MTALDAALPPRVFTMPPYELPYQATKSRYARKDFFSLICAHFLATWRINFACTRLPLAHMRVYIKFNISLSLLNETINYIISCMRHGRSSARQTEKTRSPRASYFMERRRNVRIKLEIKKHKLLGLSRGSVLYFLRMFPSVNNPAEATKK